MARNAFLNTAAIRQEVLQNLQAARVTLSQDDAFFVDETDRQLGRQDYEPWEIKEALQRALQRTRQNSGNQKYKVSLW